MDQLDAIFRNLFYQLCNIAQWIFAIRVVTYLIKNSENMDLNQAIKVIVNALFTYGLMYTIVNLLDSVKNVITK